MPFLPFPPDQEIDFNFRDWRRRAVRWTRLREFRIHLRLRPDRVTVPVPCRGQKIILVEFVDLIEDF